MATAAHTAGVATVTPPVTSPNGNVVLATLYPTSSPQATQTVALVNTLRHDLIPQAEQGTTLSVHVGGVTATNIDFSHVLTSKLPLFIAMVVILAFLLLIAVFRSLLIPLVASVMNLLSIGAALGAMNAVFNWGWGRSHPRADRDRAGRRLHPRAHVLGPLRPVDGLRGLPGVPHPRRMASPSRSRARRHRTEDKGGRDATTRPSPSAKAKSGRIIAAAAAIMIFVFGSFLPGGQRASPSSGSVSPSRSWSTPSHPQPAGAGLMHLIGPANWYMPTWLDRACPKRRSNPKGPSPRPRVVRLEV